MKGLAGGTVTRTEGREGKNKLSVRNATNANTAEGTKKEIPSAVRRTVGCRSGGGFGTAERKEPVRYIARDMI